ncbi:MAG TPA: glycogen/starch/alpha-glucan phosphorylase [Gemmataceae bacterium]|nr:glycogen/starch/alpha-glucan phosphorylase [Gemmataceae bacterium]
MLVLTRRVGEHIVIGENIRVAVCDIRGRSVRLGVTAPASIAVMRQELRRDMFQPVTESLLRNGDHFFLLADFASYLACQQMVEKAYVDQENWTRRSIINTACMGRFTSDNTVRAYAEEIWHVPLTEQTVGEEPMTGDARTRVLEQTS